MQIQSWFDFSSIRLHVESSSWLKVIWLLGIIKEKRGTRWILQRLLSWGSYRITGGAAVFTISIKVITGRDRWFSRAVIEGTLMAIFPLGEHS